MSIYYTTKAKDDLAKINWQEREKIISYIGNLSETNTDTVDLTNIYDSSLLKTNFLNHVILAEEDENAINILSVFEKEPYRRFQR